MMLKALNRLFGTRNKHSPIEQEPPPVSVSKKPHLRQQDEEKYHHYNEEYLTALRTGQYEYAVVCLMNMRLLLLVEEIPDMAQICAESARDIINQTMLAMSEDNEVNQSQLPRT